MAPGRLAYPGTEFGPCEGPCTHRDCAEVRRMAETHCEICGEPIGYDRNFYVAREAGIGGKVLQRAVCAAELAETAHN